MMGKKEWFGEWFDSPYYHILYKERDNTEAQLFIDHLSDYLGISPSHRILDLACGKGRHSIYLNEKGFDVIGLDLSIKNVEFANQHANDRLHFEVQDMRNEFHKNEFDFVLNMFTSFGYFDTVHENQLAILNIANALKPGGKLVLDFLNPYKVIHHLTSEEIKVIHGIEFHITKDVDDEGYIVKNIDFSDNRDVYHFQERVKAIRKIEFLEYFQNANFNLITVFGDYDLNPYDCEVSERMIFVVQK